MQTAKRDQQHKPNYINILKTHWKKCTQRRTVLISGWIFLVSAFTVSYSCLRVSSPVTCPVQFSSVTQSCPTLCDPMNRSMPGLPVHHQLPAFTQIHVHRVSDAIQPSHPQSSSSPPAPNLSQHQSIFQWVNSLHEVSKVLEFQL